MAEFSTLLGESLSDDLEAAHGLLVAVSYGVDAPILGNRRCAGDEHAVPGTQKERQYPT